MQTQPKKTDIAVISNPIIRSWNKKTFTAQEQRFLLFTIVDMQKRIGRGTKQDSSELLKGEVTAEEFSALLGIQRDGIYTDMNAIANRLTNQNIRIEDEKTIGWYSIFTYVKYHKEEGKISWEYNKELKNLLLNIKDNFTKYSLENIIFLQSKYAIRIYEILKSYINLRNELTLCIDELKGMLGLYDYNDKGKITGERYKQIHELKKYVLDIAKKNMEETKTCDIQFNYEFKKNGKKSFEKITFNFCYKGEKLDEKSIKLKKLNLSERVVRNKLKTMKQIPHLERVVWSLEDAFDTHGFDLNQKRQRDYLVHLGFIKESDLEFLKEIKIS